MMSAEDLAAFQALPDRLEIFRGCSVEEHAAGVYGLSWTDSRAVAEFFAWRHDAADRQRIVVSCEITRPEALAYFNARKEREIIADISREKHAVQVAAVEPSALFQEQLDRVNTYNRSFSNDGR